MGDDEPEVLLADADVLIDYVKTDRDVLARCTKYFASVHVMASTLDEVDGLAEAECKRLGLIVEPVEPEVLDRASTERLGISIPDTICLLVAEERKWTCVTNEKALRKRCDARSVKVRRGLNLMIELVRGGNLGPKHAERVARSIQNPKPVSAASR